MCLLGGEEGWDGVGICAIPAHTIPPCPPRSKVPRQFRLSEWELIERLVPDAAVVDWPQFSRSKGVGYSGVS